MKRTESHSFVWSLLLLLALSGCSSGDQTIPESGVSRALAQSRVDNLSEVSYDLHFDIPEERTTKLGGRVTIGFTPRHSRAVVLDFTAAGQSIVSVETNGEVSDYTVVNEHIVVPSKSIARGRHNTITVEYSVEDQSLNRRDELLYTLLVPDRARTLFPCFDQPDLKAKYTLSLTLPQSWTAVSNGKATSETVAEGRKQIAFAQTEPLSTYLFSFVAGIFDKTEREHNGQTIGLYHRQSDEQKRAQADTIFELVFRSIDYMEQYTGIKYPFAKYDLIVLPGFQYGGMEHTGATLYNDKRLFLDPDPSIGQRLARAQLIAHETAHMWFGDLVTMRWFDEVWIKEVFVNRFASMITRPMFPEVDYDLNFMLNYIPAAYAEDRTKGATPIQQSLDNLRNAGLVYGNTIYNKSPIVIEMLARSIGEQTFQQGLQKYLTRYSYSNAGWDDLIDILDPLTPIDLKKWSKSWIDSSGMPAVYSQVENGELKVEQVDRQRRGVEWEQTVEFKTFDPDSRYSVKVDRAAQKYMIGSQSNIAIPNSNGRSYGLFKPDQQTTEYMLGQFDRTDDKVLRGSMIITLFENLKDHTIDPDRFAAAMLRGMQSEEDMLLFGQMVSYLKAVLGDYRLTDRQTMEEELWQIATTDDNRQRRRTALMTLAATMRSAETVGKVLKLWNDPKAVGATASGVNDLMTLSLELAVRLPDRAEGIVERQMSLIEESDVKSEYRFISAAVSADTIRCDSLFDALLDPANRRIEPWAGNALHYLCHPARGAMPLRYTDRGLAVLEEVQRTGDIFFPKQWLVSLLSVEPSSEAVAAVDRYLAQNDTLQPMLRAKVLQAADRLYGSEAQLRQEEP